jgi:hypothetical protein
VISNALFVIPIVAFCGLHQELYHKKAIVVINAIDKMKACQRPGIFKSNPKKDCS